MVEVKLNNNMVTKKCSNLVNRVLLLPVHIHKESKIVCIGLLHRLCRVKCFRHMLRIGAFHDLKMSRLLFGKKQMHGKTAVSSWITLPVCPFPAAQKGFNLGGVNVVLLCSKILWVIISEQEVAFFLHLIALLLWH